MATEELDPADEGLDWKQIEPQQKLRREVRKSEPSEISESSPAEDSSVAVAPARKLSARRQPAAGPSGVSRLLAAVGSKAGQVLAAVRSRAGRLLAAAWARVPKTRQARLAFAFAVGALASFLLITVVAVASFTANSGKVVAGVHVGSTDLSGLSRDQAIAKLQTAYAHLDQGKVTIKTPIGTATMSFQEAGREPDVEAMADAAMFVGHSGNPITDAVSILRSSMNGTSIPVVVQVDPMAVAKRLRLLVGTNRIAPRDAEASLLNDKFVVSPSATGFGIDEKAVGGEIIDRLTQVNAPTEFQVDGSFVILQPQVSDKNAQDAAVLAEKMVADVDLSWSVTTPPGTYKIEASTIRRWIVFGPRSDGSYGPSAGTAQMQTYLSGLSDKIGTPPVEPSVVSDNTGKPTGLTGGKDGTGIDITATSQAIEAHLEDLAKGKGQSSELTIVAAPIHPKTTLSSLSGIVIIGGGKGAWTTEFNPDISNGQGANIRVPATLLNGVIVPAGAQFSFLDAMGIIDEAHGWKMGGVIASGKSDHTGAIGGGICSASTTVFNAAMRAGLQIDERHAHAFYIDRYPVGLDASVFQDDTKTWDLKWTNDTANPIVIRAYTTPGRTSTIVVQLWSLPLDRTVTLSAPFKKNIIKAIDTTKYTTKLKPGDWGRQEFPTDGFDTTRTRTVKDSAGNVIHTETWVSHYAKVDGILVIGVAATPAPTPPPLPAMLGDWMPEAVLSQAPRPAD